MGLLSSLFAGVSGLNSSGTSISVIGDNIANTNTVGFKASRAQFVDVLSGSLGGVGTGGSQVGAGSRVSTTAQTFSQGSLESTGVVTDMAVDGQGFFIVQDSQGVFYTRAGIFRLDQNQVLVNSESQAVLGFGVDAGGIPNGAAGAITLGNVSSAPQETRVVQVNVNLDPNDNAAPGGAAGFDHTNPVQTSDFQSGLRIFDDLGTPRDVTIYFRKDDAAVNSWFWFAGVSRGDVQMSAYGAPFSGFTTPAGSEGQFFPLQSGTLSFDTDGGLLLEANAALSFDYDSDGDDVVDTTASTPANASGWSFNNGATLGQLISFDFGVSKTEGGTGADRTTQYGGSVAAGANNFVRSLSEDGYEAGSLNAISVDENGFVAGIFSNGQTQKLAQVALARFPNSNGLARVGKSNWVETTSSGTRVLGSPNQSGFGAVRSGFLEQSNTDLAEEFVKMILSQRAFQANTRTISTTNDLLAALVNLGQ